ncbi:prepilin-type N-terminal cleavage/methylation domain-containing protein [Candidatus Kuenenbacteria bacterium]|nr:prepilin-type N-terminal cleavage/methylation domain-containing protein [Candidatus Kuenenbacteria bacterium]
MRRGEAGFTLAEMMIVMAILCIGSCVIFVGPTVMANRWFSRADALSAIQETDDSAEKIVSVDKNFFAYSEVKVKNDAGDEAVYYLDCSLFEECDVYSDRAGEKQEALLPKPKPKGEETSEARRSFPPAQY